ncbi:MAG: hypothetical protein AAGJ97_00435 [Planctomycetota bacterium]
MNVNFVTEEHTPVADETVDIVVADDVVRAAAGDVEAHFVTNPHLLRRSLAEGAIERAERQLREGLAGNSSAELSAETLGLTGDGKAPSDPPRRPTAYAEFVGDDGEALRRASLADDFPFELTERTPQGSATRMHVPDGKGGFDVLVGWRESRLDWLKKRAGDLAASS